MRGPRQELDYEPISLARYCNAGVSVFGPTKAGPTGVQHFRGLPFEIGHDPERCLVAFGDDAGDQPVHLILGRTARSVIIAHRLMESDLLAGGPAGKHVADYVFRYDDGGEVRQAIRELFEIGMPRSARGPRWQLPARALADQNYVLPPRYEGEFGQAGWRQTENVERPSSLYLWAWINPEPERRIAELLIVPGGPRFVVAAVTVGHVAEHPLVPFRSHEIIS